MNDERWFPIQSDSTSKRNPHPTRVPWSVGEKAYSVYRARYGDHQTLERLAERGGFSAAEMDSFYPAWRDEVSEIARLAAALAETRRQRDDLDAMLIHESKAVERILEELDEARRGLERISATRAKIDGESAKTYESEPIVCASCADTGCDLCLPD